jgi:hypothetical protein
MLTVVTARPPSTYTFTTSLQFISIYMRISSQKFQRRAACLCREHWPPRHRVALRRCCELATALQRCHDACFSVATTRAEAAPQRCCNACCNTAVVTQAAAALLRRLLQPRRCALATGAAATTSQRCRDESCRNSVVALSRRVLQQRRRVARRKLQLRKLASLQCSAAARHRRSGGEALHVRRKLDFCPWDFCPSDDFRPRTTFVRRTISVHGLPSVGPVVLSCTLTSYVLLPCRPVLHPDVLRLVVLSSYDLPSTSYLFIQHLFDFRAIFVCHGSFPTTHFILQIIRCVRIL